MRLPDEVRVWRKAKRTRLISEREALPIERRRAARERVRVILATEVPELRRATIGFYWPFRAEIDLVAFVRGLIEVAVGQRCRSWSRRASRSRSGTGSPGRRCGLASGTSRCLQ